MSKKKPDQDIEINFYGIRLVGLQILFAFGLVVLVLWVFYQLIVIWISLPNNSGQYGDLFGGLNALFAGFAFVGLIYTILLQRKELSLQREELKLARKELTKQTKVISTQLDAMQQTLDMEQQRRMKENAPELVGKGEYSSNQKRITKTNTGARISSLFCLIDTPNTTISPELSKNFIDQNGSSLLTLSGYGNNNMPSIIVEFTYRDVDGNIWSEKFEVPEGTTSDLIPIPGSKELHP